MAEKGGEPHRRRRKRRGQPNFGVCKNKRHSPCRPGCKGVTRLVNASQASRGGFLFGVRETQKVMFARNSITRALLLLLVPTLVKFRRLAWANPPEVTFVLPK